MPVQKQTPPPACSMCLYFWWFSCSSRSTASTDRPACGVQKLNSCLAAAGERHCCVALCPPRPSATACRPGPCAPPPCRQQPGHASPSTYCRTSSRKTARGTIWASSREEWSSAMPPAAAGPPQDSGGLDQLQMTLLIAKRRAAGAHRGRQNVMVAVAFLPLDGDLQWADREEVRHLALLRWAGNPASSAREVLGARSHASFSPSTP